MDSALLRRRYDSGVAEGLEAGSSDARYPAVAAGSGIASLLLAAVVVLMVWKP